MDAPPRRRGGRGLIWAGAIMLGLGLLIGVVGGVGGTMAIQRFMEQAANFRELPPNQTIAVQLNEPDTYLVFASVPTGTKQTTATVQIANAAGESIAVTPSNANFKSNGGAGVSVGQVEITQPGEYTFTLAVPPGEPVTGGSVVPLSAVVPLAAAGGGIICGLCGGIGLGLVGLVLLIIGLVQRSSN